MANDRESLGETLEGRYATDHVGGAFNAKNIQKPRATDKILESATLGSRKADESLLVEGLSTERYRGEDRVIPETKQAPVLQSRVVPPASITPGQSVPRLPISAVRSEAGQVGRLTQLTPPSVTPGQSAPRTSPTVVSETGKVGRLTKPTQPSVTPGQSAQRLSVAAMPTTPGKGGRSLVRKADKGGSGKPGFGNRPFTPTPAQPFGPLFTLPVPIYWDTDPDVWDYSKLVGQVFWDS